MTTNNPSAESAGAPCRSSRRSDPRRVRTTRRGGRGRLRRAGLLLDKLKPHDSVVVLNCLADDLVKVVHIQAVFRYGLPTFHLDSVQRWVGV
jgi:hypothetical protein